MTVKDKPLDPRKIYKVAGWASVQPIEPGKPVWDIVAEYLRDKKIIRIDHPYKPVLKGAANNPGMAT
jgi:sulfur-oxidizing protein SoxB